MKFEGNIKKMRVEYAEPVRYFLPLDETEVSLNPLTGKKINLGFTGRINCIACGKQTKTSFGQGFCYNCLQTSPEASESVLRPELSKAHFGIARDMEWARQHDLIPHFVYLALSGDLKVGVTRHHQAPARWIDQGASRVIRLAETPNRHIAGIMEVWLKKYFTDKTNWRDMLQNHIAENIDLQEEKINAAELLPTELKKYISPDDSILTINYPVITYPAKISSLTFDKNPEIGGTLAGIKGQYLIFENGQVVNIRKHSGYFVRFSFE